MVNEDNTTLAYDLRQKYAEIVGVHLEAVAMARINKHYVNYFHALEDLYTVISHKFKEEKTSDPANYPTKFKKKDTKRLDLDRKEELEQEIIDICNQYEQEFLGRSHNDPKAIYLIENSLRALERFYYYVMNKANVFGTTGYNEGL